VAKDLNPENLKLKTPLSRRSFLKRSGALAVTAGIISPLSLTTAIADDAPSPSYESAAIGLERDARRAKLSVHIAQLLDEMSHKTPADRLAWHRANRGAFFFSPQDIPARLDRIRRLGPGHKAGVVQTADRLLRHEFDILGSGLTALGPEIDWQRDFKSGRQWSNKVVYPASTWHKSAPPAGPVFHGPLYSVDGPADLKMPWDLSTLLHFPTLAEASLLTGRDIYATELFDELDDWHRQNPFYYGVNWTNPMVAGLRLANITCACRLLEDSPRRPVYYGETGLISILQHMQFILDALEVFPSGARNNHYLSDLAGLAFGGMEIAGHPAGQSALDFVQDEFARELTVQFLPDGAGFEGSIPYNRLSLECAILSLILLERNGRPLSDESRRQLQRTLHYIDLYTKSNGLAPQIGDNDNGRVLVLHNYGHQEYRDHRHILAVGAAWLGISPLMTGVSAQAPDTVWLLGKAPPASRPIGKSLQSGLYRDGGFAIAKTTGASLIVRAGVIHPLSGGGHNHCDQLSFEFHDCGEDVIVDPGTMVYGASGALRNRFRSTASHNTLQLDDLELQEFDPRKLFWMQERAHTVVDLWQADGQSVRFRGHHTAYTPWRVTREIHCDLAQGRCDIADTVETPGGNVTGKEFCGRLHLAPGIQATETGSHNLRLQSAKQQWTVRFSNNVQVSVRPGHVSPSYGIMVDALVIEYRFGAVPGEKADVSLVRG